MNKNIICIVLSCLILGTGFAQDTSQPRFPTPPRQPTDPVVSGALDDDDFSLFPSFTRPPSLPRPPTFPNRDNQPNRNVREIERYNLTILGAFPNGDTRNNVANTINNAEFILYSNRTKAIRLSFNNGLEYIYHLSNPRSRVEIRAGVFREIFDTTVQVGREFLLEQYLSELTYDDNSIISLSLIGNNRILVILHFSRKP